MNCMSCIYATRDYEEYYGGGRRYFVDGCENDGDIEADFCEWYTEGDEDE